MMGNAQEYKKMSPYVRQIVKENSLTFNAKGTSPTPSAGESDGMFHGNSLVVFVMSETEEAVSRYCLRHQGDIHICQVPVNELATLSENTSVVRIEARQSNAKALLDDAATRTNAADAWNGISLPSAFKGAGTLVGVIDCGIDYLHPTFRSTEDGRLKIVRAWDMLDFQEGQNTDDKKNHFPIGKFLNNEAAILQKGGSLDCDIIFHGTHTTSTAAGSGGGTPYRGMAPEADIYSVCRYLSNNKEKVAEENLKYYTDALDMLAYQNIFDYADSIGKPCVISCSFGGAQDMTDADKLMDDYFKRITGPGHIIVASAGNDGSRACYMPKSAGTKSIGGRISATGNNVSINISTKNKLKLHITDYSVGSHPSKTYDLDFLPDNSLETSPSGLPWYDFLVDEETGLDDMIVEIYSGSNEFDPEYVGYDIFLTRKDKKFTSGTFVVEIEGDGAAAEIFCQHGSLLPATQYSPTLTGAIPNSGNIGSPGSLPSVLTVGSQTFKTTWTDYNGNTHAWGSGKGGERSGFSSVGPAMHVEIKPEVMAPGNIVTAGMSKAYFDAGKENEKVVAFTEQDGDKYPWAIDSGTSMSCPVVAGIVALWLEADPTLTKEKVLDVIAHTATEPVSSLTYPNTQYGYGQIDAQKGLLYILNMTQLLATAPQLPTDVTVRPDNQGNILVTLPHEYSAPLPLRVYSPGGKLELTATIPSHTLSFTLPAQQLRGILAVQVGQLGCTLVRK